MSATVTSVGQRSALTAPIATGCCLAAAAVYVTVQDPSEGGTFIPCPFRVATGWWCPGCGLTRATHHLFRGDLVEALRYNLFVVAFLATIAGSWLVWLLTSAGVRSPGTRRFPIWAGASIGVVLVAFALARNIPLVDGLRG